MAIATTSSGSDSTQLNPAWAPSLSSVDGQNEQSFSTSTTNGQSVNLTSANQKTDSLDTGSTQALSDSQSVDNDDAQTEKTSQDSDFSSQSADWIDRFQSWSELGEAQSTIADTQASVSDLQQTYRQLQQVGQQLNQANSQMSNLSSRLQQLDQSLQQSGNLDTQLQPNVLTGDTTQQSYTLSSVDLLSSKPSDEQLRIYFPSSRSGVSVSISANASGQQVVDSLNDSLQKEGVQASLNSQGQLTLSADSENARKLNQPILMSGQGIRVPAGNAVTVKLTAQQSTLGQLASSLGSASTPQQKQAIQQQIQSLQQQIQQTVQQLRSYQQQVVQDSQDLVAQSGSTQTSSTELMSAYQTVRQALAQNDYSSTATTLQAQASVSRQTVVALLSTS